MNTRANIINDYVLYDKLSNLPINLKNEVLNYMEFLLNRHNQIESKEHPKAGCMKGTFVMSDDFKEHTIIFQDDKYYMPDFEPETFEHYKFMQLLDKIEERLKG